jgi:SAM-dependent methyltransferase
MASTSVRTEARYSPAFFSDLADDSYDAARKILGLAFSVIRPGAVVDIGCGTGAWLKAAHELGASRVVGVDGPWIGRSDLLSETIELVTCDMSRETPRLPPGTYDLAISLECGEHLPEDRADTLVDALCAASPHVIFGAATPGQGGTDHVNEQWQGYWVAKFRERGFLPIDLIRPNFLHDAAIATWYRNNPLFYVRQPEYARILARLAERPNVSVLTTDFVIPAVFGDPGLRHSIAIARKIPRKLCQAVLWRLKIRRWSI